MEDSMIKRKVPVDVVDDYIDWAEEHDVAFDIWNAAEFWSGGAKVVELGLAKWPEWENKMLSVSLNPFVLRQTKESSFSHWEFSNEELLRRVSESVDVSEGYREGVRLVKVNPCGFYSSVVELSDGDSLTGSFTRRREGEAPRKHVHVAKGEKMPAKEVDVVIYSHAVLEEGGDASSDALWEVVSVNARPIEGREPLPVETLLANHFGGEGGTDTHMNPEQFEAAMEESYDYWKNKAMLEGTPS